MRRPERCASLPEGQGEHREARLEGNFRQEIDRKGIPPSPPVGKPFWEWLLKDAFLNYFFIFVLLFV
jgi:hypothetical protein